MHILSDDYPLKSYPTFSNSIDQLLPFFLVLCCSMYRPVSLLIVSSQCKFGCLFSFRWICQASLLSLVKQIASQWAIVWWFFPCDISALMRSKTSLLVTIAVSCILKSLLQHHHSNASMLLQSAFISVQLSHPHIDMGNTMASRFGICIASHYDVM